MHVPCRSGSSDELRSTCPCRQRRGFRQVDNERRRGCGQRRRDRVRAKIISRWARITRYSRTRSGPQWSRGAVFRTNEGNHNSCVAPLRFGCMKKIRLLIADDHGVVRKGLRLQIEQNTAFEVVGEASDGREAVSMADELSPDIIIRDIAMPNLNGIQATAQIVKKNGQIGVIILSMHS